LLEPFERPQALRRLVDRLALPDDDSSLLPRRRCGGIHLVEDERVGDFLDQIEDVIQSRDQRDDVLAVEWRHERRVQPATDAVTDLVPVVLHREQLFGAPIDGVVRAEHLFQVACG
jgi:hypothetical protein